MSNADIPETVNPKPEVNTEAEATLLARISNLMDKKNYQEVYQVIEKGTFTKLDEIVDLWDEAHYAEREHQIKKPLTPLMRFRIRQRYLPPANICPSRERPTLALPPFAKKALVTWYQSHRTNPFPSKQDKEKLSRETGLTLTQVQTWFANLRRRKHCKHLTNQSHKSPPSGDNECSAPDQDAMALQAAESMIVLSQTPPPSSRRTSSSSEISQYERSTEAPPTFHRTADSPPFTNQQLHYVPAWNPTYCTPPFPAHLGYPYCCMLYRQTSSLAALTWQDYRSSLSNWEEQVRHYLQKMYAEARLEPSHY